jgi:hypothetical protein
VSNGQAADLRLRLHVSRRFQGLFHSPRRGAFHRSLTVLCAIGRCVYLALGSGLPSFTPDVTCPALLKSNSRHSCADPDPAFTVCGDAFQASLGSARVSAAVRQHRAELSCNPVLARPAGLSTSTVWADPGSLAATTGMLSVPRGSEMFQFPRCPPQP